MPMTYGGQESGDDTLTAADPAAGTLEVRAVVHAPEPGELFDASPVAQVCLDEPGRVLAANLAAARLLGRPVDHLCERPLITMVAQEDRRRVVSHLARVAAGEYSELDLTMELPHGTALPVTLVSAPWLDRGGRLSYSLGALLDVSRRHHAERTLKQAKERLDHLAHHDALTGLANRYLFEDRLQRALARCRRNGWLGALAFVDIDRFKFYNDAYGHDVGDAVLIEAATRLSFAVREQDTVCRYSGDEFLIILENVTSRADVDVVLAKLRDEFARPVYGVTERPLELSAAFGATLFDKTTRDADLLVKQADLAMYDVKRNRRGTINYYSAELEEALARKRMLEAELVGALGASDQFRLEYQPQFAAADGRVTGCEALVRWDHPQRGTIEPEEFIAVAEHAGLSERLTRWVLVEACRAARAWQDAGCHLDCIAVNVSPRDVASLGLVELVAGALEQAGLPPQMLELEVTESSVMHHPANARAVLQEVAQMGVAIALDDFGTGYSSLRCLQDYPFNRIKIDKSFVGDLDSDPSAEAIVRAMTAMAASLDIGIVAEGVETESQASNLRQLGVGTLQGFLFARPLDSVALADYVRQRGR